VVHAFPVLKKSTGWELSLRRIEGSPAAAMMCTGEVLAMRATRNRTLVTLAMLTGLTGWGVPQTTDSGSVSRAAFEQDGRVRRPTDYRQWVHVGTRVKVGGLNILDGKPLITPQILNAYVEPSAMASFRKTGKWPDGTQIMKEISSIKTGAGCDHNTNICTTELGAGIFEDSYSGLGMMVKDSRRYPAQPGHWAYFSFFRNGNAYDAAAAERGQDKCAACHVKLASDTDYVISKAHLTFGPGNVQ
jgi:Cytochrome P460